nr:hypothetical protein [Aquabacterium terrae]
MFRLRVLNADLGLPVVLGEQGWLFYEQELPTFRREQTLSARQAQRIRDRLDAWCDYAHRHGAELVFFSGPNKSTIYPEKMPPHQRPWLDRPSMLDQVHALDYRCPFIRVDLRPVLRKHRDEGLYFRWGTHWNDRGAQLAWQEVRRSISAVHPQLRWPVGALRIESTPAAPLEDSLWQWFGESDPHATVVPRGRAQPEPAPAAGLDPATQARVLAFGDSFMVFMAPTASVIAERFSGWDLAYGQVLAPTAAQAQQDAWLIAAGADQRRIEWMHPLRANVVMIEVVERNLLGLAELPQPSDRPPEITDDHWLLGVARNWAGFIVQDSVDAQRRYAPGIQVRLADRQVRQVTRTERNGRYLNVYLSGNPLDGRAVGHPHVLEVLAPAAGIRSLSAAP